MVNVATIKFIATLNRLAEMSANGIEEFSNANEDNHDQKIFYNKKKIDDQGRYYVVLQACIMDDVDCYHHDVVSYYGDDESVFFRVVVGDDDKPFVEVTFANSDECFVIEDGRWYTA